MSENLGSTQPNITISKPRRGRVFLFNALGLIVILILAIFAGYGSGISIRKNTQSSVISQQLGEQFQYALVDIEFLDMRTQNSDLNLSSHMIPASLVHRKN